MPTAAARVCNADELQQAVAAYIDAAQTDPACAEVYRQLAATYAQLGDAERTAEARQTYVSPRGDTGFFHINHLTAFAP
jgi:predicted Zn-dependent protease